MHNKDLAYYESLPYAMELQYEEGDWVVRFPELPGCIAHGPTRDEALAVADEFKSEWLESALAQKEVIPEPQQAPSYSGKVLLRLPRSLHEGAAQAAKRENVSLNTYFVQAVTESVEHSGIKVLFRLFEALLRKGIGTVLPQESLRAILVRIGVEVQAVYGSKEEPLPAEELERLPTEPPRVTG